MQFAQAANIGNRESNTQARCRCGDGLPAPIAFFILTAVLIFTYFDMYHHYWFLKLIDGYVLKASLAPALLMLLAIWQRLP